MDRNISHENPTLISRVVNPSLAPETRSKAILSSPLGMPTLNAELSVEPLFQVKVESISPLSESTEGLRAI